MPRPRTWTDEQLIAAVEAATNWSDVVRSLGLSAGGRTYAVLRTRAEVLGIDVAHLPELVDGRPVQRRRFTDDDLRRAVSESLSVAAVLRSLGYEPSGGMHRFIKAHIKRLELDTTHFVGQAWARGESSRRVFVVVQSRSFSSMGRRSAAAACCDG